MSKRFKVMKPGKYSVFIRRSEKMQSGVYHIWWQYLLIILGPSGGGLFRVTCHILPNRLKKDGYIPLRPSKASKVEHEVVDCIRGLSYLPESLILHGATDREAVFKRIFGELADRGHMSTKMNKSAKPWEHFCFARRPPTSRQRVG